MAKMLIKRVARQEGRMEVRLKKKMTNKKNVNLNSPKKVDCGTMLVTAGSGSG
jgi:hypothetical protein